MATKPIEEHRTETPTEDQLLAEQRRLEQRMLETQMRRWQEAAEAQRPPGSAKIRGFRAAGPGPQFLHDPFERATPEEPYPDEPQPATRPQVGSMADPYQNGTAPPPKQKATPLRGSWKQIAEKMGLLFVGTIDTDPGQARRDLRDNLMRHAANLAGDIGEVERLWRFALDIDKDLMGKGPSAQGGDATSRLRQWLQGAGEGDI